jgi:hypothetical protein
LERIDQHNEAPAQTYVLLSLEPLYEKMDVVSILPTIAPLALLFSVKQAVGTQNRFSARYRTNRIKLFRVTRMSRRLSLEKYQCSLTIPASVSPSESPFVVRNVSLKGDTECTGYEPLISERTFSGNATCSWGNWSIE